MMTCSKRWILCVTVAALAAFSGLPVAKADEPATDPSLQLLATITNDRDASVSELNMMIAPEDNQVTGILFVTNKHDAEPPTIKHVVFPLKDIESNAGVVLDGDATHKVFILQGTVDSQAGQGTLTLRYLSNGLLGTYHDCQVNVVRSPSMEWGLVNAYTGQPVKELRVVTWLLGISTIENLCPAN